MDTDFIVKDDMICPVSNKHCYDECCPVGSVCNLKGSDDGHPLQDVPDDKLVSLFKERIALLEKRGNGITLEKNQRIGDRLVDIEIELAREKSKK